MGNNIEDLLDSVSIAIEDETFSQSSFGHAIGVIGAIGRAELDYASLSEEQIEAKLKKQLEELLKKFGPNIFNNLTPELQAAWKKIMS